MFESSESSLRFCFFNNREFHQWFIATSDDDFLTVQGTLNELGELGFRLVSGNDHRNNLAK